MISSNKQKAALLFTTGILYICLNSGVKAEPAVTQDNNVVVAPSQIIMQVNDLGKKYVIKVTNNTKAAITLSATEGLVNQSATGSTIPLDKAVVTRFLELPSNTFTIFSGQSYDLSVRTKIIDTTTLNDFPAVVIKQSGGKSGAVGIAYAFYIPFIVQSTTGTLSMNTDLSINVDRFAFAPEVAISGKINNTGSKFFTPKGSVVISKDNVKLQEQEITTQIEGILFSGKSADFKLDWSNPNTSWNAIGEYTIESRVTNDLTDKVTVSRINFIYIPKQFIYIALGSLAGIIALLIIINLFKQIAKNGKSKGR